MKAAALIVGIDEWEKYTQPLIASIQQHEPDCQIIVIDNASTIPYPMAHNVTMLRTERLNFCDAINHAAQHAPDADWFIVLENDCLCTGPFMDLLNEFPDDCLYGPMMTSISQISPLSGWEYVDGWCVVIPRLVWDVIGPWDGQYVVSSWGDVDYSYATMMGGFKCEIMPIPFKHFWQHQRHRLPEFKGTHQANFERFREKWGL